MLIMSLMCKKLILGSAARSCQVTVTRLPHGQAGIGCEDPAARTRLVKVFFLWKMGAALGAAHLMHAELRCPPDQVQDRGRDVGSI